MYQKLILATFIFVLTSPGAAFAGGMWGGGGGMWGGGGGGGGGSSSGLPLTDTGLRTAHFQGSGNCTNCHNNLHDQAGNDVSIGKQWLPSMMSNAARDPLWQAKVKHEMIMNPQLQDTFDYKCNHCHGAIAGHEADLVGEQQRIFDYNGEIGYTNPESPRYDEFMEGITCTICHQFQDDPTLGTKDMYSGNWVIDFSSPNPGRPIFGQYQISGSGMMYMQTGYQAQYGSHMNTSDVCGVCHEIRTPVVDINTKEIVEGAKFVEQSTYLEWKNSKFGTENTTCQDCHMPKADGVRLSSWGWSPPRNDFSQHTFVGANTSMLDMLSRNRAELGVDPNADFATAIAKSRAFLQNETVALNVDSATIANGALEVRFNLDNKAGHKFPTGIQARRAWLHVRVKDASGNIIFESGRMNADGSIVGSAADTNLGTVEPHYDVIDNADQVQIYEGVMSDVNLDPTYVIFFASNYKKDNRLLPAGYIPQADIGIYGTAASDVNFVAGRDQITYRVPVSAGSYTVEADLRFQALAKPFMSAMFEHADDEIIGRFKTLYDQPETIQSELLKSVVVSVQ